MATRRRKGKTRGLLSRVRKGAISGKGARLVAALRAVDRREDLTPGQHVRIKSYWRKTLGAQGASTRKIRDQIRLYLKRLAGRAHRTKDPRIDRMRELQSDAQEVGVAPEDVKVWVTESGRRGVRRYTISSLHRFLTQPVYKTVLEESGKLKARVAVQTEDGTEGEVLEVLDL